MSLLVIAANSARLLAELAHAEGHQVIALDLFGDADTRRASMDWQRIGAPHSLRIDGERTLAALQRAAEEGALGWIPGSGFEGRPELLEQGAQLLPLIGSEALPVRRVRDPRFFFAKLDSLGVAYPLTRLAPPEQPLGWLLKDAEGTGGWHIRHAEAVAPQAVAASHYFQREAAGVPMSTTFLANGSGVIVLGHNRLIVRAFGGRPHVYCGAIGPVPVSGAVARELGRIVHALAAEFGLRGLCSLDFLLDDDRVAVLEVNPRPPASLALYRHRLPLIAAQLRACLAGELPATLAESRGLRAHRIVYARRPLALGEAAAARLKAEPDVHDQPCAGARFEAGDPVFSLSAAGDDADALIEQLKRRRDALLTSLETNP